MNVSMVMKLLIKGIPRLVTIIIIWIFSSINAFPVGSFLGLVPFVRAAGSFIVTTTADTVDITPGDGFCVDGTGQCSLRAAIMESNSSPGADVITLSPLTYTLSIPGAGENISISGDLDITGDVTITVTGPVNANIVGLASEQVIQVLTGVTANFLRINIVGGLGGISAVSALAINLTNCSVINNTETGIDLDASPANLDEVLIENNIAPGSQAGGIYAYNISPLTILDSTIRGNQGNTGGISADQLVIRNSSISGNTGDAESGGITANSDAIIVNSTISGNTSPAGGGIYASGAGNVQIINSTITLNTADTGSGGGIYANADTHLTNTILSGNIASPPAINPDCEGQIVSGGYNLFGDMTGCTITGSTTTNNTGSLLLGPLQNNGGPTYTHAPQAGSDAIDGGDLSGSCTDEAGNPLTVDQRGNTRPDSINQVCDIGSYEVQNPPVFTATPTTVLSPTTRPSSTSSGSGGTSAPTTGGTATATTVRTVTQTPTKTGTNTKTLTPTITYTPTRSRTPVLSATITQTPTPTVTETSNPKWTKTPIGISWIMQAIPNPAGYSGSLAPDVGQKNLVLDTQGQPHVVFGNDQMYYSWRDASGWHTELVDNSQLVGHFASLALDKKDIPYISYYDALNGDLKFAQRFPNGWGAQTVDRAFNVGLYTSLVIDQNDIAHIAYLDRDNDDLRYVRWTGTGGEWVSQIVDSAGRVGFYASMVLNPAGVPSIAYYDLSNGDLKYATLIDEKWEKIIIASEGDVGLFCKLVLDKKGQPGIAYFDQTNHTIMYAHFNGKSFDITKVLDTGGLGGSIALVIDKANQPRIGYYDFVRGTTVYASSKGGKFGVESVTNQEYTGFSPSLELNPAGLALMNFYNLEQNSWTFAGRNNP